MDKDSLEDLIGNQQLASHRFGSHVTNTILKLLKRVDDRITLQIAELLEDFTPAEVDQLLANKMKTKRLIRLKESLKELESEITKTTSTVLGDQGKKFAEVETTKAAALASAMGAGDLVGVSSSQVYAAAMSRPMNGKHIRDHVKDLSSGNRKLIMAAIREGFIAGEATAGIMTRIRGSVEQKRKDGLLYKRNGNIERLIVRNSLSHISSVASMKAFEQMGVDEYYLSPTFDGRTSKICASLNSGGIKYYKVGQGILPPLHAGGCRTIPLARARSGANIPKPFINDKRPLGKIPKDQRKGKVGITTAKSFDAHLKRQPVAFQKEWLGESRYKLWKEGVPLSGFADPVKGRTYSLSEIQVKYSEAFEAAGLAA